MKSVHFREILPFFIFKECGLEKALVEPTLCDNVEVVPCYWSNNSWAIHCFGKARQNCTISLKFHKSCWNHDDAINNSAAMLVSRETPLVAFWSWDVRLPYPLWIFKNAEETRSRRQGYIFVILWEKNHFFQKAPQNPKSAVGRFTAITALVGVLSRYPQRFMALPAPDWKIRIFITSTWKACLVLDLIWGV